MKKEYNLKFITPCFCAGADQRKAEIRPASIRGELRKWLRLAGADAQQEQIIMGGVKGEATKSLVTIRVSNIALTETEGVLPKISGIDPVTYLLHFANVSGKEKGQKGNGPRVKEGAFVAPNSSFKLTVITKQALVGELKDIFDRGLEGMLLLGSIGLRATRTCGAWVCEEFSRLSFDEYCSKLNSFDFNLTKAVITENYKIIYDENWKQTIHILGTVLKDGYRGGKQNGRKTLTAGKSGNEQTPLGASSPRQKSGLNLRPILTKDGIVPLIYYTDMFLGDKSKRVAFDLLGSLDKTALNGLDIRII